MNKMMTALVFSVLTATAMTATAQPADCGQGRGMGPCYQHQFGPGRGYGPGRGGQMSVEDRIDRRVNRMTAGLNLSAEQQTQVRQILQEEYAKPTFSWQDTHNRIAGVLTDQQRAQFEQWRAQRFNRGGGPGYGPGPGPGQQ